MEHFQSHWQNEKSMTSEVKVAIGGFTALKLFTSIHIFDHKASYEIKTYSDVKQKQQHKSRSPLNRVMTIVLAASMPYHKWQSIGTIKKCFYNKSKREASKKTWNQFLIKIFLVDFFCESRIGKIICFQKCLQNAFLLWQMLLVMYETTTRCSRSCMLRSPPVIMFWFNGIN